MTFEAGAFSLKETQNNSEAPTPLVLSPLLFQRTCIQYEWMRKTPIFDAYRNFCQTFGNDTMAFIEFEYWFLKCDKGNFDLNDDRCTDKKVIKFEELPIDFVTMVINKYLNDFDKLVVSQVSQSLANVVTYKRATSNGGNVERRVEFNAQDDECTVTSVHGTYRFKKLGNTGTTVHFGSSQIEIENTSILRLAAQRFSALLKCVSLPIDLMLVWDTERRTIELEKIFVPGRQIKVDNLDMKGLPMSTIRHIVTSCEPVVLDSIFINNIRYENDMEMEKKELVESNQWKSAKSMFCKDTATNFKFEDFLHFEYSTLFFQSIPTMEEVIHMADGFSKRQNFFACSIEFEEEYDQAPLRAQIGLELNLRPAPRYPGNFIFENDDSMQPIYVCLLVKGMSFCRMDD